MEGGVLRVGGILGVRPTDPPMQVDSEVGSSRGAVPAIVEQGTQSHVFVRRADGVFVRRHVERGRSDDQHVAITAGLEPGDVVVVAGAAELQTGFAAIR